MSVPPLFDRAEFDMPKDVVYVCNGGASPFLHRNIEGWRRYASLKGAGFRGRQAIEDEVLKLQESVARLWHVEPQDIGFTSSVSEGVSMVAESIDWQEGDNACIDAREYPSLAAPFALQRRGSEVRLAASPTQMNEVVNARTRVIAVSYVSYLTGERVDLKPLRSLADSVNAMLVVDYTQAAGYLPIEASIADFAFTASYKWMLGSSGAAIAYWNRKRQPQWTPSTAGWRSLADTVGRPDYNHLLPLKPDGLRFTRGNPAHPSIFALAGAVDYLSNFEMSAIQDHVQTLTTSLMDRLRSRGIPLMTPASPQQHGASVCIECDNARAIVDRLEEGGIFASNGRGRIRFSFHGFNDMADVDRIASALDHEWVS